MVVVALSQKLPLASWCPIMLNCPCSPFPCKGVDVTVCSVQAAVSGLLPERRLDVPEAGETVHGSGPTLCRIRCPQKGSILKWYCFKRIYFSSPSNSLLL